MPITQSSFYQELFEEHYDEISFLYETRHTLLVDESVNWLDFADDESRLDAHLDALQIGGAPAMNWLLELCQEGDEIAIYITCCLYCRNGDLQGLFGHFAQLDLQDEVTLNAVRQALLQEWPDGWFTSMDNYPFLEHPYLLPIFLPLYARRGKAMPETHYLAIARSSLILQPEMLASLRQLQADNALQLIPEPDTKALSNWREWVLIQVQLDNSAILEQLLRQPSDTIPYDLIMIGARPALAQQICQTTDSTNITRITAIGLAGLPDHVPELIRLLEIKECSTAAAQALHTLTGAGLTEEVFIEEEWQEDELFEDELEAYRNGQPPQHADNRPFGETEVQLSTNPQHWQAWWSQHSQQFKAGLRYRLGHLITPKALVFSLYHPLSKPSLRLLSYQELMLRYNATAPFHIEDWVTRQHQSIRALANWADSAAQQFEPGHWYLKGQPIHE